MKPTKYSEEEKLKIIDEAKQSGNVLATARRYSISDGTIHTWIRKYSKGIESKKLSNDSQLEVKKLKKQLADAQLENAILKELVKKTVQVWSNSEKSLLNSSPSEIQKLKY